jgi:Protein of unknown function (DUF2793)
MHMADTPNLVLPYLAANQSQKHVTVNEALRRLDALVQVTVQSAALASPPGSPTEGQRWILPAAPTGAWAGQSGKIAAWQDGAWAFYAPLDGWTAIDISTDTLLLFNAGTGIWTGLITGVFSDAAFTLQDEIDPTKQAAFRSRASQPVRCGCSPCQMSRQASLSCLAWPRPFRTRPPFLAQPSVSARQLRPRRLVSALVPRRAGLPRL